ncbi:MAG: transposase [Solirubrobacterales bacterium]|nr:transposase [Solirubrobacterales bacterium]
MVVFDLDNEIVIRIDAAGAATTLCQAAQDAGINFLVGFDPFTGVREAILSLPEDAWRPAIRQDGSERDGAQIAEITHVERLDLTPWPGGSRVIIRRERPQSRRAADLHRPRRPRFQATLTDLQGDAVEIECLHRAHANAEDRIRAAKQTGIENLPFHEFALNAVWLELSMIAQDLIAWTQSLCLEGELAICEPKALRYRLLHTAGRPAFHARRAVLRLQANWLWAEQLAAAFARLRALPQPAG